MKSGQSGEYRVYDAKKEAATIALENLVDAGFHAGRYLTHTTDQLPNDARDLSYIQNLVATLVGHDIPTVSAALLMTTLKDIVLIDQLTQANDTARAQGLPLTKPTNIYNVATFNQSLANLITYSSNTLFETKEVTEPLLDCAATQGYLDTTKYNDLAIILNELVYAIQYAVSFGEQIRAVGGNIRMASIIEDIKGFDYVLNDLGILIDFKSSPAVLANLASRLDLTDSVQTVSIGGSNQWYDQQESGSKEYGIWRYFWRYKGRLKILVATLDFGQIGLSSQSALLGPIRFNQNGCIGSATERFLDHIKTEVEGSQLIAETAGATALNGLLRPEITHH
jgi:hypothetical protein